MWQDHEMANNLERERRTIFHRIHTLLQKRRERPSRRRIRRLRIITSHERTLWMEQHSPTGIRWPNIKSSSLYKTSIFYPCKLQVLSTDASLAGSGAFLEHPEYDAKTSLTIMKPLISISIKLSYSQQNYNAIKLVLLAIIKAFEKQ